MEAPEPQSCSRCGAPIDATDSVLLPDGAVCIVCVDKAARHGAIVLARRQRVRQTALWSGLAVLAFVGARLAPEGTTASALGGVGAIGLVLAALSLWRASRAQLTSD
jgi:hypothetical protein